MGENSKTFWGKEGTFKATEIRERRESEEAYLLGVLRERGDILVRGCLVSRDGNSNWLKLKGVNQKAIAVCSRCCGCPAQVLSVPTSTCRRLLTANTWGSAWELCSGHRNTLGLCAGKVGSTRELMAQLWKQLSTNDRVCSRAPSPSAGTNLRHLAHCLPEFQADLSSSCPSSNLTPYKAPVSGLCPLLVSLPYSPPAFPGITSQINNLPLNPCCRVPFGGTQTKADSSQQDLACWKDRDCFSKISIEMKRLQDAFPSYSSGNHYADIPCLFFSIFPKTAFFLPSLVYATVSALSLMPLNSSCLMYLKQLPKL